MNKIIIALGVALASATAAFADSSALDVKAPDVHNVVVADMTATGALGNAPTLESRARFGDGSPVYEYNGSAVSAPIASNAPQQVLVRFGDAAPTYGQ